MTHHLVIDELVRGRDLSGAIEHQHLAEEGMLKQNEMLVLGLYLVDHALDLIGHAETEVVEQRFGNPASFSHGRAADENSGTGKRASGRSALMLPDQVSRPRRISLTSTRFALKALRRTWMHASGVALPHMNKSRAA